MAQELTELTAFAEDLVMSDGHICLTPGSGGLTPSSELYQHMGALIYTITNQHKSSAFGWL